MQDARQILRNLADVSDFTALDDYTTLTVTLNAKHIRSIQADGLREAVAILENEGLTVINGVRRAVVKINEQANKLDKQ